MDTLQMDIRNIILEIEETTTYLYQQKLSLGYEKLNSLWNKLLVFVENISNKKQLYNIRMDEQRLTDNLTFSMEAMEDKDYVLLADILVYEIAEQLNSMENE